MLIILSVSFVVYFNALFNGFVSDDIEGLVNNQFLRNTQFLAKIFTSDLGSFEGVNLSYYRPLASAITVCTIYIAGLKPFIFHLLNVLYHIGNSVLVFIITSLLFAENHSSTAVPLKTLPAPFSSVPFIAALLFATHPIHTEAVAWISGGSCELSFTFFYLLSLWLYMRYKEGFRVCYVFSLASFFASTLCKEPALTLPLILIGYDYAFKKKEDFFTSVMRYIPYFIIAGIYLALRHNALKSPPTIESDETYHALNFYQYAVNVFPLFAQYLKDLIFPFHLNFWHTFRPIESLLTARGMLSAAVAIVYLLAVFWAWRRNKMIFFCLLFIMVPLLPAFYIKAIMGKPYAERYLYLPSFGFVMLLAMTFDFLNKKKPRYTIVIVMLAIFVAGLYSIQTITRNPVWKDNLSLFRDTVRKAPQNGRPHRLLGDVLLSMGSVDEAIEEYQKAFPGDLIAHQHLADAYMESGRVEQTKRQYQEIIKLKPEYLLNFLNPVRYSILSAQSNEGVDRKIKRLILITESIEQAIKLQPNNALYRDFLGIAYGQIGLYDKAIEQSKIAVQLAPSNPIFHKDLDIAIALKNYAGKTASTLR